MNKPMLTVDQLIQHMKEKGIAFTITTEDEARSHLARHNNYFKLTSYRKNFCKHTTGNSKGKYQNLDFAALRELARFDTEVRQLLLAMALDIEHFLKVSLIKAVEDRMTSHGDEDGYKTVSSFLLDEGNPSTSRRLKAIKKRVGDHIRRIDIEQKNPYCIGLIKKYKDEMPIWTFVELIDFGVLKDLTEFYSIITGWQIPVDILSLDRVRQIRNACAHGNCIINDLNPQEIKTPKHITDFVIQAGVNEHMRSKKLSNPRINQIVHILYVYDKLVTSQNTRSKRIQELRDLVNKRALENKDYFKGNDLLISTHKFFETFCCHKMGIDKSLATAYNKNIKKSESFVRAATSVVALFL